ncbi:MAG: SagB family peptide dehydrogenase [Nitrospira sp.]
MAHPKWQDMLIPPGDTDSVWELFHENSKLSRFDTVPTVEDIRDEMARIHESLPYDEYPKIELPTRILRLSIPLGDAICVRRSVRRFEPSTLDVETLSSILYYSYGITGDVTVPRSSRAIPSGGALYPLELYFYSASIQSLEPGLYHYDPSRHCVTLLHRSAMMESIAKTLVQPEIIAEAAMVVFITALFQRSAFKYGDRGYRFVLMEAGHLAQNLHLVVQGVGLSGVSIGGFFDRAIDTLLRLDGVNHSNLCMVALGRNAERE